MVAETESYKFQFVEQSPKSMSLRTSPQTGVAIRSPTKKRYIVKILGDADCHVASLLAMTRL